MSDELEALLRERITVLEERIALKDRTIAIYEGNSIKWNELVGHLEEKVQDLKAMLDIEGDN